MRIAIVSDTHFGHSKWGEDAFVQGRTAMIEASQKADVLLMPGDIFDLPNPTFSTVLDFISIINEIKIPILAICGTHEIKPKGEMNIVKFLHLAGFLVDIHRNPQEFDKDGQKVVIVGLGGVPEDLFKPALARIRFEPKKGAFNIFVFHQSLSEFIFSKNEEFASFEDLPPGFDLYVCGHVHKKKEAYGGKLIIPGSTVLTQMKKDEEGEKGYIIYDTKTRNAEFFPIKTRPFFFREIFFDNGEPQQIEDEIKRTVREILKSNEGVKPIIKLFLSGTMREGLTNADVTIPNFEEAFVFIDNSIESSSFAKKVNAIRMMISEKMSISETSLRILREHLKMSGVEASDLKELLEKLCDGEKVDIIKYLKEVKND
ncbi:MAG: DNA repair exonuclease [Candidatus Anstonellales archaeon]